MGDSKTPGNILWEEREEAIGEGIVRRVIMSERMKLSACNLFHTFIPFEGQPVSNRIVHPGQVLPVQEVSRLPDEGCKFPGNKLGGGVRYTIIIQSRGLGKPSDGTGIISQCKDQLLLEALLLTFKDGEPNCNDHSKELKNIIDLAVAIKVAAVVNFEPPGPTGTGKTSQSERASIGEGNSGWSSEGQPIK